MWFSNLRGKVEAAPPVTQQGAQEHQAVLHAGDNFRGAVPPQEELPTAFKAAEGERSLVPLVNHLLQLLLNVSLLHGTDTDVLLKWQGSHFSARKSHILLEQSRSFTLCSLGI